MSDEEDDQGAAAAFSVISSPHDGPTELTLDLVDVGAGQLGQGVG